MITQEQLKELLHYCPETGVWTWFASRKGTRKGSEAGCVKKNHKNGKKYRIVGVLGFHYFAHRLAFLYMTGEFPKDQVDHDDGNGLNNAWRNLNPSTPAGNQKNLRLFTRNSSGATGVGLHKRTLLWRARINVNRREISLGYFRNKEDAIAARKKAEAELGFNKNHGTDRPL